MESNETSVTDDMLDFEEDYDEDAEDAALNMVHTWGLMDVDDEDVWLWTRVAERDDSQRYRLYGSKGQRILAECRFANDGDIPHNQVLNVMDTVLEQEVWRPSIILVDDAACAQQLELWLEQSSGMDVFVIGAKQKLADKILMDAQASSDTLLIHVDESYKMTLSDPWRAF